MYLTRNPKWLEPLTYHYTKFEEVPTSVFGAINLKLNKLVSEEPVVSIVIAAWNEEVNILHCIASLANTNTTLPLEIVVVNNNSTDKTQQTLDALNVKSFFQGIQGWGPARQMGLENARGKYILLADADCYYPEDWVNEMIKTLDQPGVVCVYGRYSFISEPGYPRWKLFLLEKMKDAIAEVRHVKRPYLNAYGISMGYLREYGLKVGYVMHKIRGEDGRLCFDLMQYGKIKQMKVDKARVWTSPRTLQQDGTFSQALKNRLLRESKRFFTMFKAKEAHDTKTSTNN